MRDALHVDVRPRPAARASAAGSPAGSAACSGRCARHPAAMTSGAPSRKTKRTPGAARAAGRGRCGAAPSRRRRGPAASASVSARQAPMRSSQGQRSASSSGMPARMRATFASGWRPSPSMKWRPSRSAMPAATVDLPQPETPITTTARRAPDGPAERVMATRIGACRAACAERYSPSCDGPHDGPVSQRLRDADRALDKIRECGHTRWATAPRRSGGTCRRSAASTRCRCCCAWSARRPAWASQRSPGSPPAPGPPAPCTTGSTST